ncbi:MAG: DMT family transporter [Rhodoferax sp.]|nr:DMT family transporter [Rhodoferax sp.]
MTSPAPSSRRWLIDFLLLAAIWGSSFLFTRLANQEFGALPTAGMRVAIAALFLLPLLLWRGGAPELGRHWRRVLFIGTINSGLPFVGFSYALLAISTGLSAILNATVPLFGALIAWLWLGDRPGRTRLLGLAIGFLGVALLAWRKASFRPDASGLVTGWAVLACLAACICYGIAASYTKRHLSQVDPLVMATGSQTGAALALLLPTWWLWPAQTPGLRAWLALLAAGVLCTGLAYILFFRLIATVGPARSLSVTFVVPVFAVLYGALFLGESVTPWMLFCGAVIVLGTALSAGLLTKR